MIKADDLTQAETRLRAAYGEGGGQPRESHDHVMEQARFDNSVDNYIAQHVDVLQRNLKRCKSEAEARRVIATDIAHHLAVGSVARSIAVANNRGGVILP